MEPETEQSGLSAMVMGAWKCGRSDTCAPFSFWSMTCDSHLGLIKVSVHPWPGRTLQGLDAGTRHFVLRAKETGKETWKQETRRRVESAAWVRHPCWRYHGYELPFSFCIAFWRPHHILPSAADTSLLSHVGHASLQPNSLSTPPAKISTQVQCPCSILPLLDIG